ncbi:MAG: sulfate adenylyltransferase subunit CysD [Chloroflexi bacterium]|nr:sulfate adenylyltransferase subunit CysD [Chloroflexota bacterium]MDA1297580.1 sulfate adenylyltransferase subunit CysD [Chloroflexota bacterium]
MSIQPVPTSSRTTRTELAELNALESESIHIIREVIAEFDRPALLFSGGKDSIVMLHLAIKAVRPAILPFPIVHIDTGHNFPEAIEYRDRTVEKLGIQLVVGSVQEALDTGRIAQSTDPGGSRNRLQTPVLLDVIRKNKFGAVFGGARRDEERARAKERVYSFRDEFGQWDPKNQRPEVWNLYNGFINSGQHIRVFPLSNWTELDIWRYIAAQKLEIPSIYFAHEREVFERDGMYMAVSPFLQPEPHETAQTMSVRFRTVGDMTSTAAVPSKAATIEEVVAEIGATRTSERGQSRADDRASEAAMEDRKREGYF